MKNWSREETIIAFNLYCKIAFKDSSKTHPLVVKYAELLGRSPSALNMKIGNIGRLDPDLKSQGIKGLVHGAKLEEEIWQEFCDNPDRLAFESERLIAQLSQKSIEESLNIGIDNLPQGLEREAVVKQRVSQSFFRSAVMSAYNHRCCISGITLPSLLEACHIVAWSDDKLNRTNPKNGLCMNSFFHKAYDEHLLGISPDMKIVISEKLQAASCEQSFASYISNLNGKKILLPDKFLPQRELLAFRYDNFTKYQYDE
ncbi:MAG: HNH endonuclease [Bacteroidales bacterium]|nr:HNH endonuclease [Bacteroidales bacterium]